MHQHVLIPTRNILTPCDKSSMCYAFMRAVWNESVYENVFNVPIMNHFGKHYLIVLRLWLWLGCNTAGACVTAASGILLGSIENPEHLIRTWKGTFRYYETPRDMTNRLYVMRWQ